MNAEGKALVTGASRGLGRAIARELALRGFDVVATMRNPDDGEELRAEVEAEGRRLRIARLDVDDPDTIEIPDGLRVLVNNAGVEGEYYAIEDAPLDLWRRLFETNVFGLVETTRRALPVLRASGGGVVCNVTSSSILFPMPLYAAYRASKAAVSAMGESLRAEVAGHGIRVLEILPGPIATDMLSGSDRLPESASNPAYGALSQWALEQRRGVAPLVTAAKDAARTIADAILDDEAPLRVGCDPLAVGAIDAWRAAADEDLMGPMLAALPDPER